MIFKIDEIYGDSLDFDVLESKQHFDLDSPDCFLTDDVKIQGKLEKIGQEILCKASLETGLSVKCSRCLNDFSYPVKGKFNVHFSPRIETEKFAGEVELTDSDIEQEFYEDEQINLSSPARDLVLLSVPQIRLCKEDCAGLCNQCGINLNDNQCGCDKEVACDPRLAVLQQLKDKMK